MLFRLALSLIAGLAPPSIHIEAQPGSYRGGEKMNTKETKAVAAAASDLGLRSQFWTGGGGFTLFDDAGAVAARVIDDRDVPARQAILGVIRPKHLRRVGYKAPDGSTGISGEGKYFSYPRKKSIEGVLKVVADPSQLDK
jgi:hypothetical protein